MLNIYRSEKKKIKDYLFTYFKKTDSNQVYDIQQKCMCYLWVSN